MLWKDIRKARLTVLNEDKKCPILPGALEKKMSTYHGLEAGDEIELEITQKARDGRGLARAKGLIIFVEGASPGETVKARIIKVGARHAEAERIAGHTKAMVKASP